MVVNSGRKDKVRCPLICKYLYINISDITTHIAPWTLSFTTLHTENLVGTNGGAGSVKSFLLGDPHSRENPVYGS